MLKEKLIEYLEQEDVKGAFAVKDLRSGEICTFNENEVVPSASLIKMFILIKTIDLIREGRLSLTDEIEVKAGDIVAFSVLEFLAPRKYMLEELLRLMIVYSDNTATNVLMDKLGIDQINEEIKKPQDDGFRGCGRRKTELHVSEGNVRSDGQTLQQYTAGEPV